MAHEVTKRPGEWVSIQARRAEQRFTLIVAAGLVLALLVIWASLGLKSSALALPVLAALYLLFRISEREGSSALNWTRGARSEVAVGEALEQLPEKYVVTHDIEQPFEGNIDHLVSGPSGVFLIETKYRRYEAPKDLVKAKRQAAKLAAQLDVWITPVICIEQRRGRKAVRHQGVWIVCGEDLVGWIRAQRNAALPSDPTGERLSHALGASQSRC